MSNNNFFLTTGVIFALIALLHLVRLFLGWHAVIGGVEIPSWASGAAFLAAGFLAWNTFRLRKTV